MHIRIHTYTYLFTWRATFTRY